MIDFTLKDVKVPGLDPELFVLWLNEVAKEEGYAIIGLNLVFCSDEELLKMNQEFLNHDYYTDIITFDYTDGYDISGDLFISIERVIDNSLVLGSVYDSELKRVCVHGLLHLCGYKDKSLEEEVIMRAKEDYYIVKFVSRET
jgi:probable rRNA maturation factor